MTAAAIGYGGTWQVATVAAPTVFTTIADLNEIVPPQVKITTPDITTFASPGGWMENISGMKNLESAQFKVNHIQGGANDAYIQSIFGVTMVHKFTASNGASITFQGNLTDYSLAMPIDGRQVATVSINPTGQPTYAAGAAPVNSLLPSISGLLTNGTVLTAIEGTWSGAPTFTYQWRGAGTPIGGATAKTYTLTGTEVGKAIDVIVTGTNTVGNASATSGATKNVV
jgi:predicted secreted protein